MTVFNHLKFSWTIKKKDLTSIGVDPSKQWNFVTVEELSLISDLLDVAVADLFNY